MLGKIHREFTRILLEKTSQPPAYVTWSVAPDEDLFNYHRYKYHRVSQFNKLYNLYIEKYDMREALDKKLALYVMIQHDYLDIIGGPVSVFNGLNTTCNNKLLDLIDKTGHKNTINKIYKLITSPSQKFINNIFTEINDIDVSNIDTATLVMIARLIENTIGIYDLKDLYPILDRIKNVNQLDYGYVYCQFIKMENNIIDSIETLL